MTKYNFKRLLVVALAIFLVSISPAIYLLLFGKYFNNIKQLVDYGIYFNALYISLPLLFVKLNWQLIDPGSKLNFTWINFFKVYGVFLIFNLVALAISWFFGFENIIKILI